MMQTRTDSKRVSVHFQSLHELGEFIAKTPARWRQNSSTKNRPSRSWDLEAGYERAVEMARFGWLEGAEKAQAALKTFSPSTPEPDQRVDFYGFRPHVPRYCAGAPDSMIRHTPHDAAVGSGRVLTLYVTIMSHAGTNAQHMANYGVAIAQYVNQMETEGRRVEVVACATVRGEGKRQSMFCTVKHADQPLDLAVLAFAIGHPAMLRRIWFAYMERQPHCNDLQAYGYCEDTQMSDVIDPAPGTFILNGMNYVDTFGATPESALKYVTENIDRAIENQELAQ